MDWEWETASIARRQPISRQPHHVRDSPGESQRKEHLHGHGPVYPVHCANTAPAFGMQDIMHIAGASSLSNATTDYDVSDALNTSAPLPLPRTAFQEDPQHFVPIRSSEISIRERDFLERMDFVPDDQTEQSKDAEILMLRATVAQLRSQVDALSLQQDPRSIAHTTVNNSGSPAASGSSEPMPHCHSFQQHKARRSRTAVPRGGSPRSSPSRGKAASAPPLTQDMPGGGTAAASPAACPSIRSAHSTPVVLSPTRSATPPKRARKPASKLSLPKPYPRYAYEKGSMVDRVAKPPENQVYPKYRLVDMRW